MLTLLMFQQYIYAVCITHEEEKTQERETELTGSFHRYTFFAFYFLCQRQMLFPVCNYYQLCYNLNDNM